MKALAVAGLGEQELAGGHIPEAATLFGEAVVLKQGLGDRMGMAVALDSLGRVATAEGHVKMAAQTLRLIREGNAKKGDVKGGVVEVTIE